MKKIAALIVAALVIVGVGIYFFSRSEKVYYLGTFSGRDAHLGNGFFRGFTFYVSEYNKNHMLGKRDFSALDHEGRAENLKSILEKEKSNIGQKPFVVQGSESFATSVKADQAIALPAQAQWAVSSKASEFKGCIETSSAATMQDALSFVKNNLKANHPAVVGQGEFKEPSEWGGLEEVSARLAGLDAKSQIDALILLLPADQILSTIAKLRHQGYTGKMIVPSSLSFLDMRSQLIAVEGENYLISNYSSMAQEPDLKNFIQTYSQQYHETPSQYSYFGYLCAAQVFKDKKIKTQEWLSMKAFKIEKAGDVTIAITK